MKRLVRFAVLALSLSPLTLSPFFAACGEGGTPEGEVCERVNDCDGDLYCARVVMCIEGRLCEGVCVRRCETDANCEATETCREDTIFMKYCG